MLQLLQIAVRNLLQHKRRTFLLGGVVAGVTMALVGLIALSAGINASMMESATTLMSGHLNIGGFYKVTASAAAPVVTDADKLEALVKQNLPEVDYVTARGRGWVKLVSDTASMQAAMGGIDIQNEPGFRSTLAITSGSLDGLLQPNTILLFEDQAKKLDVKVGDTLTITGFSLRGSNNTLDVRVVAIARALGMMSSFNTFVPAASLRALYQLNANSTGAVFLYLKDLRQMPQVEAKLRKLLTDHGYLMMEKDPKAFFMKFESVNREDWTGQKLDVTTWEDEVSFVKWISTIISGVSSVLIFILLVVIVVGLMNTLWISIRERTREIGTLRAIGMQRRRVMAMFMIEAFVLALGSTLAGALAGVILCAVANAAHIHVVEGFRFLLMRDTVLLVVDFGSVLFSIVLITICLTLSALLPSFLAARLKPITAMHHVG